MALADDKDNSGDLDFPEFVAAIRKGGKMTPKMISEGELRELFDAIDEDGSGDMSIRELTIFVWGEEFFEMIEETRFVPTPPKSPKPDRTTPQKSFAKAIERPTEQRSNRHAEAEAADPMLPLKKKLRGLSYGDAGQDPSKLFGLYDKDNSGELDFDEFVAAIRKGGKMGPKMISQEELRELFDAIDEDGSGDASIRELTVFVWGADSAEARNVKTPPKKPVELKTVANAAIASASFAKTVVRKERGNRHAEAEAADPMLPLKKKLRGLSYGAKGQDPSQLFGQFDKDNSGELDFEEFVAAIRKGGKMGPKVISQEELRALFDAIDEDGSGDMSIRELAVYVWGADSPEARNAKTPPKKKKVEAGPVGNFAKTIERPKELRSEQHAEAEAADPMLPLKKKLRGLSYGSKGQDPRNLFSMYDKDRSGELDFDEFVATIRKGGKMGPKLISQEDLKKLFDAIDGDGSGDVSIDELILFVWGKDGPVIPKPRKKRENRLWTPGREKSRLDRSLFKSANTARRREANNASSDERLIGQYHFDACTLHVTHLPVEYGETETAAIFTERVKGFKGCKGRVLQATVRQKPAPGSGSPAEPSDAAAFTWALVTLNDAAATKHLLARNTEDGLKDNLRLELELVDIHTEEVDTEELKALYEEGDRKATEVINRLEEAARLERKKQRTRKSIQAGAGSPRRERRRTVGTPRHLSDAALYPGTPILPAIPRPGKEIPKHWPTSPGARIRMEERARLAEERTEQAKQTLRTLRTEHHRASCLRNLLDARLTLTRDRIACLRRQG